MDFLTRIMVDGSVQVVTTNWSGMSNVNGRQGMQRPPGLAAPGMSPLSETLWRDKAQAADKMSDTSARLTWVDLWVTITARGHKQAILQGLTGASLKIKLMMMIMSVNNSGDILHEITLVRPPLFSCLLTLMSMS